MKIIRSKDTHYGTVVLYQDDEDTSKYYVKSGNSWVVPVFSTVGYSEDKSALTYDMGMDVFDKAVQDSEVVYKALHK